MTRPDSASRCERIEQLRARVEARRAQKAREQALQAVTSLLEATPSLALLGFLDESAAVVESWAVFIWLNRYAEKLTSALQHETSTPEEERQWVGACLALAGMMEKLYLGASSFWAEIQFLDPAVHLYPVWSDSPSRDLVLLSCDQKRVLVFFEEEHNYLALIRDVEGLLPPRDKDDEWESYIAKIHRYPDE